MATAKPAVLVMPVGTVVMVVKPAALPLLSDKGKSNRSWLAGTRTWLLAVAEMPAAPDP